MNFILSVGCVIFVSISKTSIGFPQHGTEYQFSNIALQIPENSGRRSLRQNRIVVPHLFEGDELFVSVCIDKSTILVINNITYSNDGASETVSVSESNIEIGKFETHSNSNWGQLWDTPFDTGFLGQSRLLQQGKHTIKLRVEKTGDCYGIELWSMKVSVYTPIDPSKFWCGNSYSFAQRKLSCVTDANSLEVLTPKPTTMAPTTTTLPPSYVTVTQLSHPTTCLDKKNVKINFAKKSLSGTVVLFRHEVRRPVTHLFHRAEAYNYGRLCDNEIWQLGKTDNDNKEFKLIYPGKYLTINLSKHENQEERFPAKILPFVTKNLILNFNIPPDIKMKEGSAYFVLGLVNLTKNADIGLRYYDHSIKNFSSTHVITFTPQYNVMGWNIPNLGKTNDTNNTIHLNFESEANLIMFDFLKLDYTKRDGRKVNELIAQSGKWKVRGLRYKNSAGMEVTVDDINKSVNIEDIVLMYQVSDFGRFQTVLRISLSGYYFPYKPFKSSVDVSHQTYADASGFFVHHGNISSSSKDITHSPIREIHIDTTSGKLTVRYEDKSSIHLIVTVTLEDTKIEILEYDSVAGLEKEFTFQNIVFVSTFVNEYYAAVNTLSTTEKEAQILSKLDDFSGKIRYTFRKMSPTTMFYTNNMITIDFPSR